MNFEGFQVCLILRALQIYPVTSLECRDPQVETHHIYTIKTPSKHRKVHSRKSLGGEKSTLLSPNTGPYCTPFEEFSSVGSLFVRKCTSLSRL